MFNPLQALIDQQERRNRPPRKAAPKRQVVDNTLPLPVSNAPLQMDENYPVIAGDATEATRKYATRPPSRGGKGGGRTVTQRLIEMVNDAYGPAAQSVVRTAQREAEVEDAMRRPSGLLGDLGVRVMEYVAPRVELGRAKAGLPEMGRSAPDRRGDFLKKAYETYEPSEGYYALPTAYGGSSDPKMFDGLGDQSQIDEAKRRFMRTHKWARNKRNAADVDVAVRYLLQNRHEGYMS